MRGRDSYPKRKRLALTTFLIAVTYAVDTLPSLADDSFPKVRKSRLKDETPSSAELQRLSDGGDGLATTYLAERMLCLPQDSKCLEAKKSLLAKAIAQGEMTAVAYSRMLDLSLDPSRATTYRFADAVCGQQSDGKTKLIAAITAIQIPQHTIKWEVTERSGSLGSQLVLITNEDIPKQILLVYHGGKLQVARVFTIFLKLRKTALSDKESEQLDLRVNRGVAAAVCPDWKGLEAATDSYLHQVVIWPPQGVHIAGPGAWFAMLAVVPDIAWYDLYADPCHDPFTSVLIEDFGNGKPSAQPQIASQRATYSACEKQLWK
jgi:hypothetical protein